MRELAAVVERDRETLAPLRDRYDAIDVELDKTGGLTEALALADAAERLGFSLMVAAWQEPPWPWPRPCC